MLNHLKIIEILISLQCLFISTMIPVFFSIPFLNGGKYNLEIPITWQIPSIILISIIFKKNIVFTAHTIYILLGLFILPIFHQGGSIGYLLTPNFGYLIGIYPLITIIDKLNKKNKIFFFDFLKTGVLAISSMHITGILYNLLQIIFYKQTSIFLYNLGKYSIGKIGYHLLMLIPLALLIKPISYLKYKKQ